MAQIRLYEQQTTAGGSLGPGADARGVEVADAGRGLAAATNAVVGVVAQKQEEAASVEASLLVAKGAEYWSAEMQRRKEAAEPGAPDFAGTLQTDFHEWADAQAKAAKSPRAQRLLANHFQQFGAALYGDAVGFEARSRLTLTGDQLAQTADAAATAALTNPDLYDLLRDDAMSGVAVVSKLNPQLGVEAARDLDRKLSVAAVTGMIQRDPVRMFGALQKQSGQSGVSAVERLTTPDRLQLMNQAEAEVNRRDAQAKAGAAQARGAFDDRVRDAQAALAAGLPTPNPPTRAEFRAFYPDDGERRAADFEGYQAIQPKIAGAALRPDSELVAAITAAAPVPGDGFADAQRRQQLLAQSLSAISKARREDPAGVLATSDPQLKAAREALGPDPSSWAPADAQAYAGRLVALEASLGLPPVVLSKHEAAGVVDRYHSQAQGGGSAAASILVERQRWGDRWPAVWAQVAPDLPGAAFAIGYGPLGMNAQAGERLAETSLLTKEQLDASLAPRAITPKQVSDATAEAYRPFAKTMAGMPGSEQTVAAHLDAIHRLATRYVAGGATATQAAIQAAREVVDGQFTYLGGPRGDSLRVPVTENSVGLEPGLVAAQRAVDALDWPAMEDARWLTRPDNGGVVLIYDGRPVTGRDGKPMTYSWQRLRELAATQGEAERRNAEFRNKLLRTK